MHGLRVVIAIIGRMCLSAIFIIAGLNKILNWESTKQVVLQMMAAWHTYSMTSWMQDLLMIFSERAEMFLCIAAVFEMLGGLLVFFGIGARFGALLLILFLIPTTIFFHAFWEMQAPERDIQVVMFMKNLAILGGLLVVLAFGAGFKQYSSSTKGPL